VRWDVVAHFPTIAMNSDTTARRVSHSTLITLSLIIIGILVWGLQYKLSLYDPPVSPSRTIAQAKLLSPNERPDSLRTIAQLRPQVLPLLFLTFLITAVCLGIRLMQLVRLKASASQDARYTCDRVSCFFFFRPPPAFAFAQ
jgi:hypothetical protein